MCNRIFQKFSTRTSIRWGEGGGIHFWNCLKIGILRIAFAESLSTKQIRRRFRDIRLERAVTTRHNSVSSESPN